MTAYPAPGDPYPASGPGSACSNCGTFAVDCQRGFVHSGDREWCCPACRRDGPRALHTVTDVRAAVDAAFGITRTIVHGGGTDQESTAALMQRTDPVGYQHARDAGRLP